MPPLMTAGAPRKGRGHVLQITDKKPRCTGEGSAGGSASPSASPRDEGRSVAEEERPPRLPPC